METSESDGDANWKKIVVSEHETVSPSSSVEKTEVKVFTHAFLHIVSIGLKHVLVSLALKFQCKNLDLNSHCVEDVSKQWCTMPVMLTEDLKLEK